MPKSSQAGSIMTAADFVLYLDKHDLTDSNAARVFGCTGATIKQWCREGPSQLAAMVVLFLERNGMGPDYFARELGISLTLFQRSQYPRGSAVESEQPWDAGASAVMELPEAKRKAKR